MQDLISSVKHIEIEGTKEELREFERELRNILAKLEQEDREMHDVLVRLHGHNTDENQQHLWRHSISVASIVNWLARRMGMPDDERHALTVAALLHDAGRTVIPALILETTSNEQWAAYQAAGGQRRDANPGTCVTPRQILRYLTVHSDGKSKAAREVLDAMQKDGNLRKYLNRPLMDFIREHQEESHRILQKLRLSPRRAKIAAYHHPEYLLSRKIMRLPKECMLLSIADKWAAMRQTEGERGYVDALSKMRSLSVIASHIKSTLPRLAIIKRRYARNALETLVKHRFEEALEEVTALARIVLEGDHGERAHAITEVQAALHICREFNGIASRTTIRRLQNYDERLESISRWKRAA